MNGRAPGARSGGVSFAWLLNINPVPGRLRWCAENGPAIAWTLDLLQVGAGALLSLYAASRDPTHAARSLALVVTESFSSWTEANSTSSNHLGGPFLISVATQVDTATIDPSIGSTIASTIHQNSRLSQKPVV